MKKLMGVMVIAGLLIAGVAAQRVLAAEDVKAVMEASNAKFVAAWEKKDGAGMAARYAADAQLLPTGSEIIKGSAAIQAFWQGAIDAGPATSAKFTTLEAEQHGDTAIEVGQAEMFDAQKKLLDTVKYIVIWKRVGGEWKMHRDIWNTNTPAQ